MTKKSNSFPEDQKPVTNNFQFSDYQSSSPEAEGLAKTHEQVSDVYAEGTVDASIEEYQGTGKAEKISE